MVKRNCGALIGWCAMGVLVSLPVPVNPGTRASFGLQITAGTCVVDTPVDSGYSSLRQCMLDAGSGDTITFHHAIFPLSTPVTITLLSPLPVMDDGGQTIDGSGAGVILDGSQLAHWNGIEIVSDNNVIRGLQILHFVNSAVRIESGAGNVIGGDWTMGQNNVLGDNGIGVDISGTGATGNLVTGNTIGDCTVGVRVDSPAPFGDANEIVGNLIGFDITGSPSGNVTGIEIAGDGKNHVISKNHVAWNGTGIYTTGSATLAGSSHQNCLTDNAIGLSHGGTTVGLQFEDNWWGSADGPSGIGPGSGDAIFLTSTGTADYEPWLIFEGAGCGGTVVFTDDFESGNTTAWSNTVP